ncbi:unnamed protein product, partial [Durusdinium trenchii]
CRSLPFCAARPRVRGRIRGCRGVLGARSFAAGVPCGEPRGDSDATALGLDEAGDGQCS